MRPSPTLVALISASLAAGVLAQGPQQLQLPLQTARWVGRSIGEDVSSSPPLPHSTITADAYSHEEEEDTARSSMAAYHHQLAAPALFANIAPGDRPPECPPCNPFNCVLPAFPCLNTGTSLPGRSIRRRPRQLTLVSRSDRQMQRLQRPVCLPARVRRRGLLKAA